MDLLNILTGQLRRGFDVAVIIYDTRLGTEFWVYALLHVAWLYNITVPIIVTLPDSLLI